EELTSVRGQLGFVLGRHERLLLAGPISGTWRLRPAPSRGCGEFVRRTKKTPVGSRQPGSNNRSRKDYAEKMRSSFSSIFTSFDFVATAISLMRRVRAVS